MPGRASASFCVSGASGSRSPGCRTLTHVSSRALLFVGGHGHEFAGAEIRAQTMTGVAAAGPSHCQVRLIGRCTLLRRAPAGIVHSSRAWRPPDCERSRGAVGASRARRKARRWGPSAQHPSRGAAHCPERDDRRGERAGALRGRTARIGGGEQDRSTPGRSAGLKGMGNRHQRAGRPPACRSLRLPGALAGDMLTTGRCWPPCIELTSPLLRSSRSAGMVPWRWIRVSSRL